jgi:predicted transcriptional regulator
MPKPPRDRPDFTPRELDVMSVLWELGSATVAEVHGRLSDDLAYTTVLTVLRTLERKGAVSHEEEGKAYRYFPVIERETAGRRAFQRIRDKIFGGSEALLLTEFMSDRNLSPEELRRLRAMVEERLKESS